MGRCMFLFLLSRERFGFESSLGKLRLLSKVTTGSFEGKAAFLLQLLLLRPAGIDIFYRGKARSCSSVVALLRENRKLQLN